MTEKDLQLSMAQWLSKYFYVMREVRSDFPKEDSRLDLCLRHKNIENNDYCIGIEVKLPDNKKGAEIGKWLKQAERYTQRTFQDVHYHIAVYPHIALNYLNEGTKMSQHASKQFKHPEWFHQHHNTSGFLYTCFGIGEVQKLPHWRGGNYIRIVFNTRVVWDSTNPWFLDTAAFPKRPCLHI